MGVVVSIHQTILAISLAVLGVLAIVVSLTLLYCLWLLLVAALSLGGRRARQARQLAEGRVPVTKFCVLIPAHNEQLIISATLSRLSKVAYPSSLLQIVVIADNCSDGTVDIAKAHLGVQVLERIDPDHGGKPSALNWAIKQLLADESLSYDAYAIIDADTLVDEQFFAAMDGAFASRKEGMFAAQGWYAVLNDSDSWRTALMAGALGLVHFVRPLARETLGLSVGLKGNGMVFSRDALERVPWRPDSLTEDIELGLDLIEEYDCRVQFVPEAKVRAQMPTTTKASVSQRQRWERGRYAIVGRRALPLLGRGLASFNRIEIDAAIDLIIPPIAELAALIVAWGFMAVVVALLGVHKLWLLFGWLTAVAALLVYIVAGFKLSDAPPQAFRALAAGPFYMVWKLLTVLPGLRSKRDQFVWVRTERAPMAPSGDPDGQEAIRK